jgi:PPOX class probable F420-dependent enzyme
MARHQRDRIAMDDEEVQALLAGRHTLALASIGPTGRVHLVPMWYGFVDGTLAFHTKAKSQKVQNLRRDPRVTCLVETGERYEELRGAELVGTATVHDDPELLWAVGVSVFERYVAPVDATTRPVLEAMLAKRVAVLVHPESVVSWDHRKLGRAVDPMRR